MELFFNVYPVLLRLEIVLFLLSFGYFFYFLFDKVYSLYKESQKRQQERLEKRKQLLEKQKIAEQKAEETPEEPQEKTPPKKAEVDSEKLRETLQRVQINKARWYFETARSLVIEGLTIDKNHRELNLELWEIYELEENYAKAEYIYRDMLEISPDNVTLLKKLGNVLSIQGKTVEAVQVYEKAYEKKKGDIDVVDTLSTLFFELKNFKKCLQYAKLFLKDSPRNIEKLGMKAYCLEKQWKLKEAIECYKKIVDLQPYNMEVKERIQKLES